MKKSLMILALLAGCEAADRQPGGQAAGNAAAAPEEAAAGRATRSAVSTAELTGLYESAGARPNQLCIIDRGSGNATFGLAVWGGNDHSCSGSGSAVRTGESLRLTMEGDESCAIEARISGGTVTLPQDLPAGCSYYCGARARMNGAAFQKTGDTAQAAMRATDLVGDPLCAGTPG